MIKGLINRFIRNAVDELFVSPSSSGAGGSASKDGGFNINFGAGDLFTDSSLNLSDLTLRKDVFNILLEPLNMISGHIGQLSLQGIAEALLTGGKVACTMSDVYLLFDVNSTATAEEVQLARKILLELLAGTISQTLLRDLLKKIQQLPVGSGPNLRHSRKVSLDLMHNLTKNFSISVKGCHIRIELNVKNELVVSGSGKNSHAADATDAGKGKSMAGVSREAILRRLSQVKDAVASAGPTLTGSPEAGSESGEKASGTAPRLSLALAPQTCDALGAMVPYAKVCPAGSDGHPHGAKNVDPFISLSLKRVQLYCDYDCDSYCKAGYDFASISQQFRQRWKTEMHTAVIPASDFELRVALDVRRASGLVLPKVVLNLPKVRVTVDRSQLRVLRDLAERSLLACRRNAFLRRQTAVYSKSHAPPRLASAGGVHVLPQLLLGCGRTYPSAASLLQNPDGCSLAESMKRRRGKKWARIVWRAAIAEVLFDIRWKRPFGRWQALAKLCVARRRYAFLYSKHLKSNAATKAFSFNVNARVSPSSRLQLFEFEMTLPVSTIRQFRSVAYHICYAELFNKKKLVYRQRLAQSGEKVALRDREKWDRVNLTYADLLYVNTLLTEAQRQTIFDGYYRKSSSFADAGGEDSDDDLIAKIIETSAGPRAEAASRPSSPSKLRAVASAALAAKKIASTPKTKVAHSAEKAVKPVGSSDKATKAAGSSTPARASPPKPLQSSPGKDDIFSMLFGASGSSPPKATGGQMKAVAHTMNTIIKTVGSAAGFDSFVDDIDRFLSDESGSGSSSSFSQSLESLLFGGGADKEDVLQKLQNAPSKSSLDDSNDPSKEDLLQLAGPPMGGQRPSVEGMRDALVWALPRHRSPLAWALPDVTVHIALLDLHLRHPLEGGARRNIVNVRAEQLDLQLQISQADSDASTAPPGKVFSRQGPVHLLSLFGCLVQLKLVVKSASTFVSLESGSVDLANAFSGIALAGRGDGLDSDSDDSVGEGSPPPPCEDDSDDDIAGRRVTDFLDAARNASQKLATGGGSWKQPPSPSATSTRDASPAAQKVVLAKRGQQSGAAWAPLLLSEGAEDALTLCIMLSSDNDDKGGGGLDLHVLLGGARLSLTGEVIAACCSGGFAANAVEVCLLLQDCRHLLALRQLSQTRLVNLCTARGELLSRQLDLSERQALRRVEEFRRYRSWLSLLRAYTPHAASCYVRASPVSIEAASQATLTQAVAAATTRLADAAVGRRGRTRSSSVDDVNDSLADPAAGAAAGVIAALLRLRSWEPSSLPRGGMRTARASLPGLSLFVSKAVAPQHEVRVEVGGASVVLPMEEEALIHGIAAILSSL